MGQAQIKLRLAREANRAASSFRFAFRFVPIFVTEDAGDAWKAQLNPEDAEIHFMAFAPRDSMFGLVSVSNQPKIVFTTDGKTWRSVELELNKASLVGRR
jgi:hypothetical protein